MSRKKYKTKKLELITIILICLSILNFYPANAARDGNGSFQIPNDDLLIGGTSTSTADSILTSNGSVVFNEQGLDKNFRVESLLSSNGFVFDGTYGILGLGTTTNFGVLNIKNQDNSGAAGTAMGIEISDEAYYAEINFKGLDDDGNPLAKWQVGATGDTRPEADGGKNTFYIFQKHDNADAVVNGYRMSIDDNGNVGIGTVSPTAQLEVNGQVLALTFNGTFLGNGAGLTSISAAGNDQELQFNDGGKLGSSSSLIYNGTNSSLETWRFRAKSSGSTGSPAFSFIEDSDTGMYLSTTGPKLSFAVDGSRYMDITTAGNVGIGDISPDAKLEVNGTTFSDQFLTDAGSATATTYGFLGDTNTGIFSPGANTVAIATSGVEYFSVSSIGNVGIGYTNPLSKLHINGQVLALTFNGTYYGNGAALTGITHPAAGSNTEIQFNDSTEFNGDSLFTWTKGTSTLGTENLTVNGITIMSPSSLTSVTAGDGLTVTKSIMKVQGDSGAIDITANPQIVAGSDGQMVIIKGSSETNTLKLDDGTGLNLSDGVSFTLTAGDIIVFIYDSTDTEWIEISRSSK